MDLQEAGSTRDEGGWHGLTALQFLGKKGKYVFLI